MADVTGPIATMPGSRHALPPGEKCDQHPDREAVARVQGETDSFGSEMIDCCAECLREILAYKRGRAGICDWCKNEADDLRDHRDYEEGTCGRIYDVCGACRKREAERLEVDLDDRWDDD